MNSTATSVTKYGH